MFDADANKSTNFLTALERGTGIYTCTDGDDPGCQASQETGPEEVEGTVKGIRDSLPTLDKD